MAILRFVCGHVMSMSIAVMCFKFIQMKNFVTLYNNIFIALTYKLCFNPFKFWVQKR